MTRMKNILAGTAALMILFVASPAFAQDDTFDVSSVIQNLQEEYDSLKEQVDSGDMTADEALALWQDLMDEAWAQKEAFFDARMERLMSRIETVAEADEDRAALLEEQLTTLKERRQDRLEIHTKLRYGEITLEEAQQLRAETRVQTRMGEGVMNGNGQGAGAEVNGAGMGTPPEGFRGNGTGTPPTGTPGDGMGTPPEGAGPMGQGGPTGEGGAMKRGGATE